MWIALIIIVALVAGAVIYLASLDGNFQVKRERVLDAPRSTVFDAVVDFKTWPEWSPWLMHEPDAQLVYSDNCQDENGYYDWDGKRVGAGRLTHVSIKPGNTITQQIDFIRPFKSTSAVSWSFADEENGKTRASWEMSGSMPFLFRFMAAKMGPMIGRDYDLGLALLNGYVNADASHPRLDFHGSEELEDFNYCSIPFHGNLRQLETARRTNIETLQTATRGKSGLAFCLFNRLDPLATDYHGEIAVPVADATPASNYTRRSFKGGRYFKMTLHGDHQFLPLGWYALFSHCRMHGFKVDKSRPALEIYQNDLDQVEHSNQLATVLYLAIR